MEFISHLADDGDHRFTACGELWQDWQKPDGNPEPVAWSPGFEPHKGDTIRLCGACLRLSMGGQRAVME